MDEPIKPLSDLPAINRFLSYCRVRPVPTKTVLIPLSSSTEIESPFRSLCISSKTAGMLFFHP